MDTLKIGNIINSPQDRDAVHMAIAPTVAGEDLRPGSHVQLIDGIAWGGSKAKCIGIVDPFLEVRATKGEKFWLFLYPGSITSLRHDWTHPAFGDEIPPEVESRRWIERFAATLDQSYNRLMLAASTWVERKDYTYDNTEAYKGHYDEFPEFWKHYEIVTGETTDDKTSFFTCSC